MKFKIDLFLNKTVCYLNDIFMLLKLCCKVT